MSPPADEPPPEIEAIPDELFVVLLLLVVDETAELLLLLAFVCCFARFESTTGEFSCFSMHEEFLWSPLFTILLSLFTADDVLMPPLPLSPVVETIEPAAFSQLNETEQDEDETAVAVVSFPLRLSTASPLSSPPLPLILLLLWGLVDEVGDVLDASFRFLAAGCSRVEEEAACSATWGLEDICCYSNDLTMNCEIIINKFTPFALE